MSARSVALPTARLQRAPDGTPFSDEFQDVYHGAQGGLAQARHVFLHGNGLPTRWQGRASFAILETGFGIGLNFLATWDAWRADAARCDRLHFVSVERQPFAREDLAAALQPFAALQPLAQALCAVLPPPLAGFHRLAFDAGRVSLTLLLGEAAELLPQLVGRIDACFLDGFAPARNPGIWSPPVVRELARLAAPGATLATWTVAGGVRAALADAGFAVEKRTGLAPKREMLVGTREGAAEAPAPASHAVVVGGGLAGTLVAERLAARGWTITLVDGRDARAMAGVAIVRPIANLRDAMNARISRAAFLHALQHYRGLQHDGYHLQWERCGVLQLAQDDDEAARFEAIAASQGYPPEFLRVASGGHAAALAGRPVRGAGWHFPDGAIVVPGSLAIASLARAGTRVRQVAGRSVARIAQEAGTWRALDASGESIAEAPWMILANGVDAARLVPGARLALSSVRGQLTYVSQVSGPVPPLVVSGAGYVAPLPDGGLCMGATYRHDDSDPTVRASDHRENLARAETLLPGVTDGLHPMQLGGWTGFRTTVPDRLPVFGTGATPGLAFATGLGSRGLLWGPLGAELLAAQLAGEPLPLPRDQAGAISPRRFLS